MSKIVIIGASIIDILVCPASAAVFETGSYSAEDIRMALGADALNEALVLAKLGKNVRLETIVGEDHAGRFITDLCLENGIVLEKRQIKRNVSTGINVVLVQENGERSFLTNPNGTLRKLTIDDIRMPFDKDAEILCFASIFVFPDIRARELVQIFSQAKRQGIVICADMTKRKGSETLEDMAEAFSYIDYLFPNEEEACILTGEENAEKAAEKFLKVGVKHVIIKCGARGCLVKTEKVSYMVPAVKDVSCIDTTGAGDSFTAGFVYALSERQELYKCAEYANLCGAKAVQSVGATQWLNIGGVHNESFNG